MGRASKRKKSGDKPDKLIQASVLLPATDDSNSLLPKDREGINTRSFARKDKSFSS